MHDVQRRGLCGPSCVRATLYENFKIPRGFFFTLKNIGFFWYHHFNMPGSQHSSGTHPSEGNDANRQPATTTN
jgi:hypothetical protein